MQASIIFTGLCTESRDRGGSKQLSYTTTIVIGRAIYIVNTISQHGIGEVVSIECTPVEYQGKIYFNEIVKEG